MTALAGLQIADPAELKFRDGANTVATLSSSPGGRRSELAKAVGVKVEAHVQKHRMPAYLAECGVKD